MKKKNTLLISLLTLFCFNAVMAQSYEIPQAYDFKTKEDYAKYEEQIIQTANWLESTPLNQEPEKRKEANAFLVKWITGSPSVTIALNSYILPFSEKNADFLIVFMGGWAKYKLENKSVMDEIRLNVEGIKSIIKLYKLGGAQKDKTIGKLSGMSDKELADWVKKKMNK
jgi:hypothetical protein